MKVSIINKFISVFKKPSKIILLLAGKNIIKMSDCDYLKLRYKCTFNKELNLDDPSTFNEKLQWLKLNDRKKIYTNMVDKYEVKKFVSNIIGEKYIIPTLGIYDSVDEIDFESLPNQFVIKCTHDSGGLAICKDKKNFNTQEAVIKINKSLKKNYYYSGREWPYKNVKPRIIVEKYMEDDEISELRDYKFFCFNGEPKIFKIDFNRYTNHQANYYNIDGNLLKFGERVCPPDFNKKIAMPKNLTTMIKFARKLSRDIPFLRVDFYETNGNIYFGELTFFPASGFGKFEPEEWDKKIGEWLVINKQ